MRIVISGSRVWPDKKVIHRVLSDLAEEHGDDLVIVHGGAAGADTYAHDACMALGIKMEVYLAEWDRYGRGAGYMRNTKMLNTGPDLVIAFHAENSAGTKHTIRQAMDRGIPTLIVHPRA